MSKEQLIKIIGNTKNLSLDTKKLWIEAIPFLSETQLQSIVKLLQDQQEKLNHISEESHKTTSEFFSKVHDSIKQHWKGREARSKEEEEIITNNLLKQINEIKV